MKKDTSKEAATKADVLELKADVGELKTDVKKLKADVGELKTDVAGVKVDVAELTVIVDTLAVMTAKEFLRVDEKIDALNEKVDTGFTDIRKEMQDGFRMILAAVESVEYTQLRMRIDALEYDMEKVKEKVKK